MIVQCPACRALVDVAGLLVDPLGQGAGVVCSACRATTWLPLAADDRRADADADAPSDGASGDTRDKAPEQEDERAIQTAAPDAPFDDALLAPLREEGVHADLVDAFRALRPRWHDRAAHRELIQRATLTDDLPFLGRCYRAVLDAHPDDTGAKTGQELILGMAMATMGELRSAENPYPAARGIKIVVIGFGVLFFGAALFFFAQQAFGGP